MAHIRSLRGSKDRSLRGFNDTGFDDDKDLLVLSVGQTSSLYFSDTSVLGTGVEIDPPDVAKVADADVTKWHKKTKQLTAEEKAHPIHKLTVKGLKVGSATLRAKRTVGSQEFPPIKVRVVDNADYRQAGKDGTVTPEFRKELQAMGSLREGVLRVAEDQIYSKIGRTHGGGFGRYGIPKDWDWCGAFAWYCWATACSARGVDNPFGDKVGVLASVQKAMSWALQTDGATILRYEGGDPYGRDIDNHKRKLTAAERETQEFIDIDADHPLLPGDICLIRDETDWRHICLVEKTPTGDVLETIDGNQGNPSIRKRKDRRMSKKVHKGKDFALIFLHVDV